MHVRLSAPRCWLVFSLGRHHREGAAGALTNRWPACRSCFPTALVWRRSWSSAWPLERYPCRYCHYWRSNPSPARCSLSIGVVCTHTLTHTLGRNFTFPSHRPAPTVRVARDINLLPARPLFQFLIQHHIIIISISIHPAA